MRYASKSKLQFQLQVSHLHCAMPELTVSTDQDLWVSRAVTLLFSECASRTLIQNICSQWDDTRLSSLELLRRFPAPLPGYETAEAAAGLIANGLKLMNSVRMREADAGAMLLSLAFEKYIWTLGWEVTLTDAGTPHARIVGEVQLEPADPNKSPLRFVQQLLDLAQSQAALAARDIFEASHNHPVFGTLLTLR